MHSEFEKYPKLKAFLDANNLKIVSAYRATDLDCAYKICSKSHEEIDRIDEGDFYVCFMHNACKGSGFSWGLTKSKCMDEQSFVNVLEEINQSEVRYLGFGQTKYFD